MVYLMLYRDGNALLGKSVSMLFFVCLIAVEVENERVISALALNN